MKINTRDGHRVIGASVGAFALLMPAVSYAQIDEIIVTATKREQSVQDIPIAVSAFGSDQLEIAGVRDIRDLEQLSSSFSLTTSTRPDTATPRIRNVGTLGNNAGFEGAVGVFIDGVFRARPGLALSELGSLERVEILRGSQGTLFGRNTSAGALSIVTKSANLEEFEYSGDLTGGRFSQIRASGRVSGPVIQDELGFSLELVYANRDGIRENLNGQDDQYDQDRFLGRAELAGNLGDSATFRLIGDYTDFEENCCGATFSDRRPGSAGIQALVNSVQSGAIPNLDDFDRETYNNRPMGVDVSEWGLSGEINWDIGPGTLVSISSYRDYENTISTDPDFSGLDFLFQGPAKATFETFSQELRYNGETGPLNWLVGAFYYSEKTSRPVDVQAGTQYEAFTNARLVASPLPFPSIDAMAAALTGGFITDLDFSGSTNTVSVDQKANSFAFFTHNDYSVTDELVLTLGGRYSHEEKEVTFNPGGGNNACEQVRNLPGAATGGLISGSAVASAFLNFACFPLLGAPSDTAFTGDRTEDVFTGTAKLSYTFPNDWLTYISASRGYKGGGFNLDNAAFSSQNTLAQLNASNALGGLNVAGSAANTGSAEDLEFEEELVDSYELGLKADTTDLFGGLPSTLNVAVFHSFFRNFQVNEFNGVRFVATNAGRVFSSGVEVEAFAQPFEGTNVAFGLTYADTKYGDQLANVGTLAARADRGLSNAPLWSINGAITQLFPLGNLTGVAHIDARWQSTINTDAALSDEAILDDFAVINARLGIRGEEDRWALEVFGRNIFDAEYASAFSNGILGIRTTFPNDPATYGVVGKVRF